MFQVIATSFIQCMIISFIKHIYGNIAQKSRFLKWWMEVQKRCKQTSYVLEIIKLPIIFNIFYRCFL